MATRRAQAHSAVPARLWLPLPNNQRMQTQRIHILARFGACVNSGTQGVSVQIWGIEKAAVGATLVVARLVSPDIGGPPAGRPQGSPLPLRLLYPVLSAYHAKRGCGSYYCGSVEWGDDIPGE